MGHNNTVSVGNNATASVGNGPRAMNMLNTWNNIEIDKLTKSVVVGTTTNRRYEDQSPKLKVGTVHGMTVSSPWISRIAARRGRGSALLPGGDQTVTVHGLRKTAFRKVERSAMTTQTRWAETKPG